MPSAFEQQVAEALGPTIHKLFGERHPWPCAFCRDASLLLAPYVEAAIEIAYRGCLIPTVDYRKAALAALQGKCLSAG